jgi:hypothetical protein
MRGVAAVPAERSPADNAIVRRALYEPQAFTALFDRHADDVHRYVVRRLGPVAAEDVSWMASGMGLPSTEEFERIPRDPSRLILYARAQFDPSPPTGPFTDYDWGAAAPFFISLLTTSVIVPPDLRAALVEALAYAPQASVIDEELGFRGRLAAVIDIPPFGSDLILDRDTHEYLGSRWELGPSDMKGRNGRLFRSSQVRFVSYLVETGVVDRMGERP